MATFKQKLVFKKMVDLGGSIGKAMVAVGYSKATAKTPQKLTESKGWKELMGYCIPEEELAKKHSELLDAVKINHFTFPNSMSDEEIKEVVEKVPEYILIMIERNPKYTKAHFSAPDNAIQLKSVELGLKLHGLLGRDNNKASDREDQVCQEIREAVLRIRKILPASEL